MKVPLESIRRQSVWRVSRPTDTRSRSPSVSFWGEMERRNAMMAAVRVAAGSRPTAAHFSGTAPLESRRRAEGE